MSLTFFADLHSRRREKLVRDIERAKELQPQAMRDVCVAGAELCLIFMDRDIETFGMRTSDARVNAEFRLSAALYPWDHLFPEDDRIIEPPDCTPAGGLRKATIVVAKETTPKERAARRVQSAIYGVQNAPTVLDIKLWNSYLGRSKQKYPALTKKLGAFKEAVRRFPRA